MIILNFSHPLTQENRAQIESLAGEPISQVIVLPVQFDPEISFLPQLDALMRQVPLTEEDFQSQVVLVNLPSLNTIAALVTAALHARTGKFPTVLRQREVEGRAGTRYEAAELLNLQSVRSKSRPGRFHQEPEEPA